MPPTQLGRYSTSRQFHAVSGSSGVIFKPAAPAQKCTHVKYVYVSILQKLWALLQNASGFSSLRSGRTICQYERTCQLWCFVASIELWLWNNILHF